MRLLLHCFLIVAIFCFCAELHAQQRSTFGFNLGYEFGAPLDISRDSGEVNPFVNSIGGTSQNHTGWIGGRYLFASVIEDVHLRLGLDYGLSIGRFTSDSYFDSIDVRFSDFTTELDKVAEKSFTVASTTHLLSPSIAFDWQPGSSWRLGVGLWGTMRIGGSATRQETILGPPAALHFKSTLNLSRDLYPEQHVSFTYFRIGPSVSSSWKINAGRNLEFRPEIFGKLDLLSAKDLGIRAFSGGIRFNFNFDPEVSRGPRDIIDGNRDEEVEIKELPKLTAAVRITSNGVSLDQAITAEPRSILYRRFETILPYVEVPTVSDRQRVERLIEILGKRLTEVPASLSLAPTASDPTLPEAAREFANNLTAAVERYRTANGAQHAAPTSINVSQPVKLRNVTSSGLAINSDQPSVLRPFADQWIDSRYQLPPITIERFTDSRAGLKSWNVTVRQGRRMLARYSNLEGSTAELESGLFLASDQSSTIEPVYAEMTVTDIAGQVETVFDTLQIRKGVADPHRADSTVYEFLFYSSASNNALSEQLGVSNKLLMKTLKDQVGEAKNLEIHYSQGSQRFASEIFNEISGLLSEDDNGPEIRLRSSREVAAPAGINAVRVLLSH